MRFSASLLVAVLALSLPAVGNAQKKGKAMPEDVPMATTEEYTWLNGQKEVSGSLTAIDTNTLSRTVTLRVEYQDWAENTKYKPSKVPGNPNGDAKNLATFNRLMQDQQRAMAMTNPNQQIAALNRVQTQYQNLMNQMYNDYMKQSNQAQQAYLNDVKNNNFPYIQVTKHKDVQLELQDKVIVRRLKMPMEYDDKGFVKEYTKEELDKLHLVDNKDKKLPGLPAKWEDVLVGEKVTLGLTPMKKDPPAKKIDKKDQPKDDPEEKKADPKDPPAAKTPVRPTVRLIVITDDSGAVQPGDTPTPTKKKKKD